MVTSDPKELKKNADYTCWEKLEPPSDFEEYQNAYKSNEPLEISIPILVHKKHPKEIQKDFIGIGAGDPS